ncbi:MAG: hypothetical protein Q7K55_01650 [Candidatus Levybacteria bacterium]|nr:hypothetical protein [Candidatus Levybacteria bacterium]
MADIIFDPFQGKNKRFRNNTISITRASGFGFNSGFYYRNSIKDFKYVLLFFNKEQSAIGFQFLNDGKHPGVLTITHDPRGNSGSITALSFISASDIDVKAYAGRYEPKEQKNSKQGKIFYILLKEKLNRED